MAIGLSLERSLDTVERKKESEGCYSLQYNSNDFITGYADSGIAYTHVGATQILSSLRLRVLDPQTKELAGGLGDNSTVILEVVKAPSNSCLVSFFLFDNQTPLSRGNQWI